MEKRYATTAPPSVDGWIADHWNVGMVALTVPSIGSSRWPLLLGIHSSWYPWEVNRPVPCPDRVPRMVETWESPLSPPMERMVLFNRMVA